MAQSERNLTLTGQTVTAMAGSQPRIRLWLMEPPSININHGDRGIIILLLGSQLCQPKIRQKVE